MTDLKSLIAELEQAKEGSRKLSDKVLLACGWTTSDDKDTRKRFWCSPEGEYYDWWDDPHARSRDGPPLKRPSPTESLDAALTLVPKGWMWELDSSGGAELNAGWGKAFVLASGSSPALALCIAALKARE